MNAEEIFKKVHLIRTTELKFLELFNEGKIAGTVHTSVMLIVN